jgi:hypothetical protein
MRIIAKHDMEGNVIKSALWSGPLQTKVTHINTPKAGLDYGEEF